MSAIDLIEIIRKEGCRNISSSFFIAEITKNYPNTELKFNNMDIYTEQLYYTQWVKYMCEGVNTDVSGESLHFHHIKFSPLSIGDKVLIRVLDDKNILIVDKVVR